MSLIDVNQSALFPAGTQASSIYLLWSLMLAISIVVLMVVGTYVLLAVRRGIRNHTQGTESPRSDQTLAGGVAVAVGTTVIVLVGLLVASIWTGRELGSLHAA